MQLYPCPGELYKLRIWMSNSDKRGYQTKFVIIISEHYVPLKTHGSLLYYNVLLDGRITRFNITQFTNEHAERLG
jgi:hypothetical protein